MSRLLKNSKSKYISVHQLFIETLNLEYLANKQIVWNNWYILRCGPSYQCIRKIVENDQNILCFRNELFAIYDIFMSFRRSFGTTHVQTLIIS